MVFISLSENRGRQICQHQTLARIKGSTSLSPSSTFSAYQESVNRVARASSRDSHKRRSFHLVVWQLLFIPVPPLVKARRFYFNFQSHERVCVCAQSELRGNSAVVSIMWSGPSNESRMISPSHFIHLFINNFLISSTFYPHVLS